MGGKCGICGDPVGRPLDQEAPNGKYFSGIITQTYRAGSVIDVRVEMMANHAGWFIFKICPVTNPLVEVTQACLDKYPLEIVQAPTNRTSAYRWDIPNIPNTGKVAPSWDLPAYTFKLKLPQGLVCDRCVMQWDWTCGHRPDTTDGKYDFGNGPQETFRGCADVRIVN